jgi:hypothetical protein
MSILAPADADNLVASGLASPVSSHGTRSVHKRRLNRSSDEENSDIPLTPPSSFASSPPAAVAVENFSTIPEILVSLATLQHLGFTKTAAEQIWDRWTNWPPGAPGRFGKDPNGQITFLEVALGHLTVGRSVDIWDDDTQKWHHCMTTCGIDVATQEAIMLPMYRKIRLGGSCIFWLKDTVALRYRGLVAVQAASRERAMAIQRTATRPYHPSSQFTQLTTTGPTESLPGSTGSRSVSATMRQAPGISASTAFSAAVRSAPTVPGLITLYKGLDQARLEGFFNDRGEIAHWPHIISDPPTDFLGNEAGYNFAADRRIAEMYACYAKRRDSVSSVVILHVSIPNHLIESLSDTDLQKVYWPNLEWKSLIWHCRTRRRLPKDMAKFKRAQLIIGTIATHPAEVYRRMHSLMEINEDCVLKTDEGRSGIQYVFRGDGGEEFLEQLGSERVNVHPVSTAEHGQWEAERRE